MASTDKPARILSVDIFRGLTMLVMIFVNDLASVKGLPWWTYHRSPSVSGMTYVDVVFPAFVFIVGMAIPLAVRRRYEQDARWWPIWLHILLRSFSLVVLGLIIANAWTVNATLTGVPTAIWAPSALLGAMLFWMVYPKDDGREKLYRILRYAGLAVMVTMLAIYRRKGAHGNALWLDFGYWEILGLIGKTYLATCLLYIPFRRWRWAPAVWLVLASALNIGARMGLPRFWRTLPSWAWPFGSFDLVSVALAGIVASTIFLDREFLSDVHAKLRWALGYAAVLAVAGYACEPLGISKNAGTPAWCFYSAAISVALFAALYWLVDVRGVKDWTAFVKPAGSNTLLTYLLPDLYYYIVGTAAWMTALGHGAIGVARSITFTLLILGASALLTRAKLRMQL